MVFLFRFYEIFSGYLFRILWWIIVATSIISCNLMVMSISQRYLNNPYKIIVASSHLPSSELPIPAITFCRINRINHDRAIKFVNQL